MQHKNIVINSSFDNSLYDTGAGIFKRTLWYYINYFFFKSYLFPIYSTKVFLLRLFGAKIGRGLVIKPNVNIKFPWKLSIGDDVWIGEGVWIDNLASVVIGDNVCISQKAYILTGSHNYKSSKFDLMVGEVLIEAGVWACAGSVILPGTVLKSHCVILPFAVVSGVINEYSIVKGNTFSVIGLRNIV